MDKNVLAFQEYLLREKNYSTLTVNAYVKDLGFFASFLKEEFGDQKLKNVSYHQVRNWIVFLSNQELTNRTINRKLASLKAFYKFLLKIKEIEIHPLAKHQAFKTTHAVQIPFSEKELNNFSTLSIDDSFNGVRNKLIVEMFYSTGMRRSELINLRLHAVDLSSKTIKVLGKRNKERILPLLNNVAALVENYLEGRADLNQVKDADFFFLTNKGNKLYESLVYRIINEYFSVVSEKVKKSPHVLRHSFATHMLNNGADLNSLKELLGHSSLASTQIYLNSSLSELKKVYAHAHPRSRK